MVPIQMRCLDVVVGDDEVWRWSAGVQRLATVRRWSLWWSVMLWWSAFCHGAAGVEASDGEVLPWLSWRSGVQLLHAWWYGAPGANHGASADADNDDILCCHSPC